MPTLSGQDSDHIVESEGRALLRVLGDATGAEGGSIYHVVDGRLMRLAALDPGHAPRELSLPLAPGSPFELVWTRGEPVLAGTDLRFTPSGWSGYRSPSFLVLPVRLGNGGDGLAAVISLHDKSEPPFTEEDARLGAALAERCAATLRGQEAVALLHRESRRGAALFATTTEAVLVLDSEQHVLQYNPAAEALFGYSVEQILGRPAEVLIPERYRDGHRRYFGERLASAEDHWPPQGAAELRIRRVDGSERSCEVRLTRVRTGDEVELVICLRDITPSVRMAERLAARERELLEVQRLANTGLLAESVVVDVRERLEGIIGRTQAALERVLEDAITVRHLDEARKAGVRALEMTKQLGSFADPADGDFEELDLNEVISGFDGTFRRLLGSGLTHTLVLQPGLYRVRADRPTVEHILANLALHCRESLAEGHHVTVHTANVRRPGGRDGRARSEVHLLVEDDGHGLSERERQALLGAAEEHEEPRARQLGLAVVFSLVERCGGEVEIDSQRGRGTRFGVALPAVGGPARELDRDFYDDTLVGNETILLVDEDAAERRRLVGALKAHRYKVIQAGRAEEALQLVEDFPDEVHMVVAHHAVPEMGGNALLERVQVARPECVLLLSGTSALSAGQLDESEPTNAETPTHPALLLRAVRALLDRAKLGEGEGEPELTTPGLRET